MLTTPRPKLSNTAQLNYNPDVEDARRVITLLQYLNQTRSHKLVYHRDEHPMRRQLHKYAEKDREFHNYLKPQCEKTIELLNMQFGRRDDSPTHTLRCRSHNNPMLWPSTGGVQTIVRWIPLFSLLTYLLTLHTTNRPRQSKFTMLLSLNYINETMYYWGVNSKMQTSHTLCSRPERYGALQVI